MGPVVAATVVVLAVLSALAWVAGAFLGKRGEPVRDWLSMHTRHRRLRLQPLEPGGRPIEEIAADLRRLGGRYHRLDPRASYAKAEGVRTAYDRVLAECCASLGITHLLGVLPPGPLLDDERVRVEEQLADSGVRFGKAA